MEPVITKEERKENIEYMRSLHEEDEDKEYEEFAKEYVAKIQALVDEGFSPEQAACIIEEENYMTLSK